MENFQRCIRKHLSSFNKHINANEQQLNLYMLTCYIFFLSLGLWIRHNHIVKEDHNHHKLYPDQQLVPYLHSVKAPPPRIPHFPACMHAKPPFDMSSKVRMRRCRSGRIRMPEYLKYRNRSTIIAVRPLCPYQIVWQYPTVPIASINPVRVDHEYPCCRIQTNTCQRDPSKHHPIREGRHHSKRFGSPRIRHNHRHHC